MDLNHRSSDYEPDELPDFSTAPKLVRTFFKGLRRFPQVMDVPIITQCVDVIILKLLLSKITILKTLLYHTIS